MFSIAFQEYQQLSSKLVQSEASASVLELCSDYRNRVEQFLTSPLPCDEASLLNYQHLCKVNLLLFNNAVFSELISLKSKEV